ncbi:hypothetical protein FNU76_21405 [Chitinimonas arctica]|uniref:Uncharacterized protein n=1 Tax=Chitinimonas arctica TaxID=2594795 RepID=A0A516SKN0_9NEIS|nr:hypothetical protein [Chitinimonas arctica]QDQ28704.1 hypothetical protein FNU76_21405 [Chitinimonas arctica]
MNRIKLSTAALLLATAGTAQAAIFSPEELGTPNGKLAMKSLRAAPADALEAAMPRYDQTKLQQHLMQLAKNGEALSVARGLGNIHRTGTRATLEMAGQRETGEAQINAANGELRFDRADKLETISPIPLAVGHMQKATIADQHKQLLASYGIDKRNTQLIETNVLVQQTEALKGGSAPSEPKLQGYLSVAVRAAGELIVEDQRARLVSDRDGRLRMLSMNWPALKLSAATAGGDLKSRAEVLQEIANRLGGKTQLDQVDVRMAVVLRPLTSRLGTVHVPAMRVGVTPRNGEAGEIFYVDLSREAASAS